MDLELFHLLNSFAGLAPWLDWLLVFCAEQLPYLVIALLLGIATFAFKEKRERLAVFFVPLVAGLVARFGVVEVIRLFCHRSRPFVELSLNPLFIEGSYSFPSGHAIFFFALASTLFFYNKTAGVWFGILALIISLARVASGVHYPSDILGGAILGIIVGYLVFKLSQKFFRVTSF